MLSLLAMNMSSVFLLKAHFIWNVHIELISFKFFGHTMTVLRLLFNFSQGRGHGTTTGPVV